jgi:WD40 repeat protein
VTADDGGQVLLWDPVKPAQLSQWKAHEGLIVALAWSPDGKEIATASEDGTVRIWDAHSGRELASLPDHPGGACGCQWGADGQTIFTVAVDGTLSVWDKLTGRRQLWACLLDDDGQWLVVHPGGWFDGAPEAVQKLLFYDSHAGEILPEPEKAQFHVPNLVKKLGISCE